MIPTHGFLPMIVYLCCTETPFFVLSLRAQDGIEHTALWIFWVLNSMLTPIWSSWALPFWNMNRTADGFPPSVEPFYGASRPSALGALGAVNLFGPCSGRVIFVNWLSWQWSSELIFQFCELLLPVYATMLTVGGREKTHRQLGAWQHPGVQIPQHILGNRILWVPWQSNPQRRISPKRRVIVLHLLLF